MISIEHLRILVAVAENTSLRQAADKLHKTQPAISLAIKQMEALLGLELFDRDAYRLRLNDRGLTLYEKAKVALAAHNDLLVSAEHFSQGYEAKLVLAIEASFQLLTILPALEQAQANYPNTQIVITQQYISGALQMLTRQQADLAISPVERGIVEVNQCEMKSLSSGRLLNVATPDLLARHSRLHSIKQLVHEYQVVVQDSGTGTEGISLGVQTAQRYWYVNDFNTKQLLIESGMGWGRLPEYLVEKQLHSGKLVVLALEDFPSSVELNHHLLRRSGDPQGPVAKFLWRELTGLPNNQ